MNHNHPHLLALSSPNLPYKCSECKELGFGQCYSCAPCDFYMHEVCARAGAYASHPFINGCRLEYRARCKIKTCDACRKSIEGSRYRYKLGRMSSLDYHPCWLALSQNIDREGIQLRLVDHVSSKCLKCKKKSVTMWGGRGWSYVSSCGKICYHVACVKGSIVESYDKGTLLGRRGGRRSRAPVAVNSSAAAQQQHQLARQNGGSSSTGRFILKVVAKMAFKLITSVIFGDHTMISSSVFEYLSQSN